MLLGGAVDRDGPQPHAGSEIRILLQGFVQQLSISVDHVAYVWRVTVGGENRHDGSYSVRKQQGLTPVEGDHHILFAQFPEQAQNRLRIPLGLCVEG